MNTKESDMEPNATGEKNREDTCVVCPTSWLIMNASRHPVIAGILLLILGALLYYYGQTGTGGAGS